MKLYRIEVGKVNNHIDEFKQLSRDNSLIYLLNL